MIFPFTSLSAALHEWGLVISVVIGFFFGFVLERAGFGRATKLAAQFYFYDMTVFKVMFSAIVTAMVGMVIFSGLGLADLTAISESVASTTFIWPMILGGFMLGVGFIVSGYCPGTSLVSAASGHIDGLMTFAGVIFGTLAFGELYPLLEGFNNSGNLGQLFLYNVLGIPVALLAGGVALMALALFYGAEKVEKALDGKASSADAEFNPLSSSPRMAFGLISFLTLFGLLTLGLPTDTEAKALWSATTIRTEDFARAWIDQPWTLRIIDIRKSEDCGKKRIPGSECVPADQLENLGLQYSNGSQQLILVDYGDIAALPEAVGSYPGKISTLKNGYAGWKTYALDDPPAPGPEATAEELEAYKFQAALHGAMTGAKPAAAPVRPVRSFVAPKKKKGGGCN